MDVLYKYRADGMRLGKYRLGEGANYNLWLTRYDGQMPIEEAHYRSGIGLQKLSRNLIGARSIEAIQTTVGSTTTTAYPLYDLMGNMKATLAKSGSTFSTTNWRQWDAWGELRSSDGTGGPAYGFVANLGHPGDAEGSLTYMRARYYEAATGRFVSEDPAMDGDNWFTYCLNAPSICIDVDGLFARKFDPTAISAKRNMALALKSYASSQGSDASLEILPELLFILTGVDVPDSVIDVVKSAIDLRKGRLSRIKLSDSALERGDGNMHQVISHVRKISKDPESVHRGHWEKEIQTIYGNWVQDITR
jgi:RHS repeat-associated protein